MTFHPPRPWTPDEDAVLRQSVGTKSFSTLGLQLRRSPDSVKNRAATLGLYKQGFGDGQSFDAATRHADRQFAQHYRQIAIKRQWLVYTYRKGAGA